MIRRSTALDRNFVFLIGNERLKDKTCPSAPPPYSTRLSGAQNSNYGAMPMPSFYRDILVEISVTSLQLLLGCSFIAQDLPN